MENDNIRNLCKYLYTESTKRQDYMTTAKGKTDPADGLHHSYSLDNKHFKYLKYDLYVKKIEDLWRT